MANATPLLSKLVLDHLFGNATWVPPSQVYLALFTDAAATTEVTGGSYVRQAFSAPAVTSPAQQTLSGADVAFAAMPACTIRAVALVDALTGTGVLMIQPTSAPVVVPVGDTVTFGSGQIAVKAA